jgi:hypothetical protein
MKMRDFASVEIRPFGCEGGEDRFSIALLLTFFNILIGLFNNKQSKHFCPRVSKMDQVFNICFSGIP